MNKNRKHINVFVSLVLVVVASYQGFKMHYAVLVLKSDTVPFQRSTQTIYVVRKNTEFVLPAHNLYEPDQEVLFKGWIFDSKSNPQNKIMVTDDITVYASCKVVTSEVMVENVEIPFKTMYVDPKSFDMIDPVQGENGVMEVRIRVIYHDDEIFKTEKPIKFVKTMPIDEIKHINLENSRQE
ncbi:hypothetical protein LLS04_07340 [Erysipelothrix enhydrae]|uniref:hypothetical protein n=1 Tax=Erysipelothrix enhydrae TaxID=2890314 RepID=UPI002B248D41|nr:hypothetical protein [Erysipelothrix sp. 4322-04]WRB86788.1 hypothetical protein LLS04_07340 [Erysipelothrix sp. 4322-04]